MHYVLGLKNRQTGSNSVNEHSSRSHSLLTLHIDSEIQDPDDDNVYITKHGKLTFVDLAGKNNELRTVGSPVTNRDESPGRFRYMNKVA